MDLESRVDKLEEKVEDLSVLPAKLDILIELQQENNRNQKELTKHIGETYVSKELCAEKHKNLNEATAELKDFRKWVYASLISGLCVVVLELSKVKLGG